MLIIPAILTNNLGELTNLLEKANGVVQRVQIDVVDNKFTDNITVDPAILRSVETSLNLDFHLMVKNPVEWINHCMSGTGKKGSTRVIGHIEYMESQKKFAEEVSHFGALPGLAVDLETPVEKLDQDVLQNIAVILLMSVPAGFGGQEFSLDVWGKIEKVGKLRKELGLNFKICVDGGITKELVTEMENMDVDEIAVGERIFEPDLKTNLMLFNNG